MSLTNSMWEGVCSHMQADWAPYSIKGYRIHSEACNTCIRSRYNSRNDFTFFVTHFQ